MSLVELELEGGVAIAALSVPERRNALSRGLLAELIRALGEAERLGAGAIVLTGRGPVFSAGADLAEVTGTVDDVRVDDAVREACAAIGECPLPVLAAIEGGCVGAAVDLALACDARVLAENAYFSVPAVALGILYSPEALARMAGRAGHQTLVRLLLLGERIAGEQAVAAGLAVLVAAPGEARAAAVGLARGATAGDPRARAATKRALVALAAGSFTPDDWQAERLALLGSASRAERVRAARERLTLRS